MEKVCNTAVSVFILTRINVLFFILRLWSGVAGLQQRWGAMLQEKYATGVREGGYIQGVEVHWVGEVRLLPDRVDGREKRSRKRLGNVYE